MEKGSCKMGWFVRNKIDQFEGFVIGKVYWLYGCERIILKPKKRTENSIFGDYNNKVMISEEYLEVMPDEDNSTYQKEFIKPDVNKYFGMLCRDKVTGFEGVAIGCMATLYNSDLYALEPLVKKNNKSQNYEWFDVGRLEILSRRVTPEEVSDNSSGEKKTGGCDLYITPTLNAVLG